MTRKGCAATASWNGVAGSAWRGDAYGGEGLWRESAHGASWSDTRWRHSTGSCGLERPSVRWATCRAGRFVLGRGRDFGSPSPVEKKQCAGRVWSRRDSARTGRTSAEVSPAECSLVADHRSHPVATRCPGRTGWSAAKSISPAVSATGDPIWHRGLLDQRQGVVCPRREYAQFQLHRRADWHRDGRPFDRPPPPRDVDVINREGRRGNSIVM